MCEWFSNHWCWESLPVFSITATGEEKENLTAQALALSLMYKFVTPLTSMVVTKPEEDDNEEGIADKPTEGTDIFTIVLYLRSQKFLWCSPEERLSCEHSFKYVLKDLLSKPGTCVVYAKLLLIVKLISIQTILHY